MVVYRGVWCDGLIDSVCDGVWCYGLVDSVTVCGVMRE